MIKTWFILEHSNLVQIRDIRQENAPHCIYREVDSVFRSSVPSINRDTLFIAFIELAVVICRCENQKESTHYWY